MFSSTKRRRARVATREADQYRRSNDASNPASSTSELEPQASSAPTDTVHHEEDVPTPQHPISLMFSDPDPLLALEHLLSIDAPTLIVKELAEGKGRDKIPYLSLLVNFCDRQIRVPEIREKLASLLLRLLGSESFLESAVQESVNKILEAVLPTKLFKIGDGTFLGDVLVTSRDATNQLHMCNLLKEMLDRFPAESILQLQKLFLTFPNAQGQIGHISDLDHLIKRFAEMSMAFAETGEVPEPQNERFSKKSDTRAPEARKVHFAGDPDATVYAISKDLLPTYAEMTTANEEIKVRTNPIVNSEVSGSLHEYLDTQWRLLRSDALSGIRAGIFTMREARKEHAKLISLLKPGSKIPAFSYPNQDTYYAYHEVLLCRATASGEFGVNAMSILFRFVPVRRSYRPIDWSDTKRLTPGSLVVLSADHFETLIWGTVCMRKKNYLEFGLCAIEIDPTCVHLLDSNASYEMLESRALWASYKPVLDRLVRISENSRRARLPLANLLIGQRASRNTHIFPGLWYLDFVTRPDVHSHQLEPFLLWSKSRLAKALEDRAKGLDNDLDRHEDEIFSLHMRDYARGVGWYWHRVIRFEELRANPFAHDPYIEFNLERSDERVENEPALDDPATDPSYPGSELTTLDPYQWTALRMMLTQRLSLVQGPPGTGKTFIGLKAVRALLDQGGFSGPILCICYTNHALDQFLEGILEFEQSVVRIGNRCKSRKIEEYLLPRLMEVEDDNFGYYWSHSMRIERAIWRYEADLKRHRINHIGPFLPLFWQWIGFMPPKSDPVKGLRMLYELIDAAPPTRSEPPPSSSAAAAPPPESPEGCSDDEDDEAGGAEREESSDEEEYMTTPETLVERFEELNYLKTQFCPFDLYPDWDLTGEEFDNFQKAVHEISGRSNFGSVHLTRRSLLDACRGGTAQGKYTKATARGFTKQTFMQMPVNVRKSYVLTWLELVTHYLHIAYRDSMRRFRTTVAHLNNYYDGRTADFLRTKRVVGMTTTGAAKHAAVLEALRPRVVIVEEAAEIFEAHVIAALTPSVEKLILIGDHQQLRPKVAHHPLTKRGLDISLFERLIMAGMPHVTLRQQHRMHPDISKFLTPIYPNLFDGPQTRENRLDYEDYGFERRVHFITHNWPESGGENEDEAASKSNSKEAKYIYGLVRYLISQGMKPSNVTVIAMYRGQSQLLSKLFRAPISGFPTNEPVESELAKVKICCVDEYQGEENQVIVVSLVRSNSEGLAGFVRIANRVCVALSRAKSMMFILGSADTLSLDAAFITSLGRPEPPIWPLILDLMLKHEVLSDHIKICCPVHQDNEKSVKRILVAKDWKQSFSVCSLPCETQLECGHWCKANCHGRAPHPVCQEPCQRYYSDCGHKCPKKCNEPCGNCEVWVNIKAPCGHSTQGPCHTQKTGLFSTSFKCDAPCDRRFPCGHRCTKKCGQPCGDCRKTVAKVKAPCGHMLENIPCNVASDPQKLAEWAELTHIC